MEESVLYYIRNDNELPRGNLVILLNQLLVVNKKIVLHVMVYIPDMNENHCGTQELPLSKHLN